MGWRKDFKDTLITELKKIAGVGSVQSDWEKNPTEHPALIVSLGTETYTRMMGSSIGVEELGFEIMGRLKSIEDIENKTEELLDRVIEKIEGITAYDTNGAIILDDAIHQQKTETDEMGFVISGRLTIRKDYSSM